MIGICIAAGSSLFVLVVFIALTRKKKAEAAAALQQRLRRLLALRDEERSRIATQLHDTTAQNLAATRLQLLLLQRSAAGGDPALGEALDELVAFTDQSIAEIRTLSFVLNPPMHEQGLGASLRSYVKGFEARTGIVTRLELTDDTARLPPEVELAVFRMVQEALTSIHFHSGGSAAVVLERQPQQLRISIGGMPYKLRENETRMRSAGVEFAGIEERARELGAVMEIDSDGDATRVQVILPIMEG